MSRIPTHDPVAALAESDATGVTAAIFEDIRAVMAIPLVTSIWRVLAGVDGALARTWQLAGPIVRSGQAEASLERLRGEARWPVPAASLPEVTWRPDLPQIEAVVSAYTRGNTLSLLVLSALVTKAEGEATSLPVPPAPAPWLDLPPLRARQEIDDGTWAAIERVNRIGATVDQPGVATRWRHLATWPELLEAIADALRPLESNGSYARALTETVAIARTEAGRLAHLRPPGAAIPDVARTSVQPYVTHPGLVLRMVVIGHILARWLGGGEASR